MKSQSSGKRFWMTMVLCAALVLSSSAAAAGAKAAGEPSATDAAVIGEACSWFAEPVQLGNGDPVAAARMYLQYWPMSRAMLVKQLQVDNYTAAQAEAAADACGADWNEQAVLSARSYLDTMSFTSAELLDQLQYDGFTAEEAAHGVRSCGVR